MSSPRFWIEIGQQLLQWFSGNSSAAAAVQGYSLEDQQILETQVRSLREGGIDVPSSTTTMRPIYLEQFRLGAALEIDTWSMLKTPISCGMFLQHLQR